MAESTPSESQPGLLLEVAGGVERAMEHCIRKYGGLVWTIAKRYVKDHASAEDVVQETFTDLWKSARRYDPAIATECTFIGMLARRRAIDWARKESRKPIFETLPDTDSGASGVVESAAAIRCEAQDVRKALKQLPEETQHLFSLHFEQGMTHPEIVVETGLPLGTVKTRLRRGLIEVRNLLAKADPPTQTSPSNP